MTDLKKLSKDEMKKTHDLILGFPWEDAEAYGLWLAQTYYMVNHSTRLVALAAAYSDLGRNDLHARFVDHAKEERGHQQIALNDLKGIKQSIDDLPCLYPTASIYQIQYYWIEHRGVAGLFGYILFLECLATEFGPELYRRTSGEHGAGAAKFLKVHSEDDVDHTEKAFKLMESLSAEERALVAENMAVSGDLYRCMLTEVEKMVAQVPRRKAA